MIKKRFFLVMLAVVFVCGACKKEEPSPVVTLDTVSKTTVPTLFLHGSGGGIGSLGSMLERFETQDIASKDLLLTVSEDGRISEQRNGKLSETNPTVQVIFEENNSDEWHQAEWLKAVLEHLRDEYGVDKVKLVGHSMGGIAAMRYLVTYGMDSHLPIIEKVVAIGSPYNNFIDTLGEQTLADELKNGPSETEPRYEDYVSLIHNVPEKTDFLFIGGQLSEDDLHDGIVALSSALALTYLLREQGLSVTTEVIQGSQAEHSAMHENPEVDQLIANFLWSK